jgi:putative RecB family exonuclease
MTDDRLFDEGEGLFEVNPSKLQCYLDCPRLYRFRYIERRRERRAFAHTALGRSVHKALREFYARPGAERTLPFLLRELRRAWDGSGYRSQQQAEDALERAERMLATYHGTRDHAAVRPMALESKFRVSHPKERILVTGRVDRIDIRDDEYVIVDYKTGNFRQDSDSIDASLPLSLYAMAVGAQLGKHVGVIVLEHLASGRSAETRRDPDRLRGDWKSVVDIVEEMRAVSEHPPRTGPLCRWCDYLALCPDGQMEVNARS